MNNKHLIEQLRRANKRHCLDVIEEAAASLEAADKRIAELEARTPADFKLLTEAEIQVEQRRLIDTGDYDAVKFAQSIERITLGKLRTPAAPVVAEGLDQAKYQNLRWRDGHEARVAAHPVAGSPAEAKQAMSEAWQVLLDAGVCPGTEPMSLADGVRAALATTEPMPASEAPPILANGLPVEQTSMEWVCRFVTENSSFDGKDILRSWNELVAFYVANRDRAAPVPASEAAGEPGEHDA